MATNESFPGTVLFVDDDKGIRDVFALVADSAGLSKVEIFEDADSAEARLKVSGETVDAILSDGLNGGWKQIIAVAKEAKIPAFVLSSDISLQAEVEAEGVQFIPKEKLSAHLLLKILADIQTPGDE